MKIELNLEDLNEAAKAINNAAAAYNRLRKMIMLGLDLPLEFEKLYDYKEADLKHHIDILKDILNQLDEYK